jgi:type I restriction enzyme M protein
LFFLYPFENENVRINFFHHELRTNDRVKNKIKELEALSAASSAELTTAYLTANGNAGFKAKYKEELEEIKTKLFLRGTDAPDAATKKELRQQKKKIDAQIQEEIRAQVKEKFDYDIPIATVEKAGISSTGGVIDNELTDIQTEYTPYRLKNELWKELKPKFEYKWSSITGTVERIINDTKTQLIEW